MGEPVLVMDLGNTAPIAAHFVDLAVRKCAAAWSFDALRRDLEAHGAPGGLGVRAHRAAAECVHHARIAAALILRFGGMVSRTQSTSPRWAARPLGDVALENARVRCVRGACSAALAGWQARHAELPAVRHAMARIAYDEERHVALVWRVHAWARDRLGESGRVWLDRAIDDASRAPPIDDLVGLDDAPARALGLPRADQARAIADGMLRTLR